MDPYSVLGVKRDATQEEIRKAYLDKVKQYHPDLYVDSPMQDMANEKLKEINNAYDMIKNKDETGGFNGQGNSYNPFTGRWQPQGSYHTSGSSGSTGSRRQSKYAAEYQRVRSAINAKNYNNAKIILNAIRERDAEWHYLRGVIHLREREYDAAREELKRACELDPEDSEYRNMYLRTLQINNYDNPLGTLFTNCNSNWCKCCVAWSACSALSNCCCCRFTV